MFKKIRSFLRLRYPNLDLRASHPEINVSPEERNHRHNMEEYASGSLRMQHEALQKNMIIMFLTMTAAVIAVIASITIGILSLTSKPNVTIRPTVIVKEEK